MAQTRTFQDKIQDTGKGGALFDKFSLPAQRGGQQGFRHKIAGLEGGTKVLEIHNDTKHTNSQVIARLMHAPKGFDSFNDPQSWYDTLKHMVEVRPESITGLKAGLQVEFAETNVSGAGEKYYQPINVMRDQTEVEFIWRDIVGRPIQTLLHTWIMYFMMDPDTKVPKISSLTKYATDAWSTEYQTMTVLFMEPDTTHRYIDKAWLTCGMMPKTTGPIDGRRNLMESAAVLELTIPFTGTTESTQAVVELAEIIFAQMDYIKSNTDFIELGVESPDTYLTDAEANTGYQAPTNTAKVAAPGGQYVDQVAVG